jgi:hypothetical protein
VTRLPDATMSRAEHEWLLLGLHVADLARSIAGNPHLAEPMYRDLFLATLRQELAKLVIAFPSASAYSAAFLARHRELSAEIRQSVERITARLAHVSVGERSDA